MEIQANIIQKWEPKSTQNRKDSEKWHAEKYDARKTTPEASIQSVSGQYPGSIRAAPGPGPAMETALNTSAGGSLCPIY